MGGALQHEPEGIISALKCIRLHCRCWDSVQTQTQKLRLRIASELQAGCDKEFNGLQGHDKG